MTRRTSVAVVAVAIVSAVAAVGTGGQSALSPPRTLVLAELFTSEGCSSCPPADALLRRLLHDQPVAGVEVVALGSHVDYWNDLGWPDPFSSAVASERQLAYGRRAFGTDRIYTPQIVVDGTREAIGSDEAAVRRTLLEAARQPHATVGVLPERIDDASVRVSVRVSMPANAKPIAAADLIVAITEDGLSTRVPLGENGGRTLAHSAVVRIMRTVARVPAASATASATATLPLDTRWTPANLRVVAFLQERDSGRVAGTGVSGLIRK